MKRIALYSFLALGLPAWAGAADPLNTFAWERLPAYNASQVVIGPATTTHGIHQPLTAATSYVTLPLTIPDETAYAEVSIRSGTSTAYIASASSIAGGTMGIRVEAGLFTRKDDADFYVNHHHDLGSMPSYFVPYMDTTSITYKAAYGDLATLFDDYGNYYLPNRAGFLVLRIFAPDAALEKTINDTGLTITVRFARDGR